VVTVADLGIAAVAADGAHVAAAAGRAAADGDARRCHENCEHDALHGGTFAQARARCKTERSPGLPAMAHRMLCPVVSVLVAPDMAVALPLLRNREAEDGARGRKESERVLRIGVSA